MSRIQRKSSTAATGPLRHKTKGLLASTRAQLGDLPAGVVGWNEALESARTMQDRYGEARVLCARGRSYARQETPEWNAALADLDRAKKLFEGTEARPSVARALLDRSKALRGLGRASEAADGRTRRFNWAVSSASRTRRSPDSAALSGEAIVGAP